MTDIGHEVPPHLLGLLDMADVMQADQHTVKTRFGRQWPDGEAEDSFGGGRSQDETRFRRQFFSQAAPQRFHSLGLSNDRKDGVTRKIIAEGLGSGTIGKDDLTVHCNQKNRIGQILKQKRRRLDVLRQQIPGRFLRWP